MTALTLDLPDEKLRRLEALAEARGTNIVQIFEEMCTIVLAQADAETRFRQRAQRGSGREVRDGRRVAWSCSIRPLAAARPVDCAETA